MQSVWSIIHPSIHACIHSSTHPSIYPTNQKCICHASNNPLKINNTSIHPTGLTTNQTLHPCNNPSIQPSIHILDLSLPTSFCRVHLRLLCPPAVFRGPTNSKSKQQRLITVISRVSPSTHPQPVDTSQVQRIQKEERL